MKNVSKLFIILLLLTVLLVPVGTVFGEPAAYGNVYLQPNRFIQLGFAKNTETGGVWVTATALHSQVDLNDFNGKFTLKTKSGKPVTYEFIPKPDNSAWILFSIGAEDVYLNLIEEEFNFPNPKPLPPMLSAPYDLTVDLIAYRNAAQFAEWEEVRLTISGLTDNIKIIDSSVGAFQNFKIRQQYHMNFLLERMDGEQVETLLFEGSIPTKMKLPSYNKRYQYAMLEQLDAMGVRVTPLEVKEENGFFYVNLNVAQNGDFSVVGYENRIILPWWVVLLACLGGVALIIVGVVGGILIKKHKNGTLRRKPSVTTATNPSTLSEGAQTAVRPTTTASGHANSTTARNRRQAKSQQPNRGNTARNAETNQSSNVANLSPSTDNESVPSDMIESTSAPLTESHTEQTRPVMNVRKNYLKTVKRNIKKKK